MKKLKRVPVWQTSDEKTFDIKAAADKHQAALNVAAFFESVVDHDTAVRLVDLIKGDLDGFREVAGPLIRKPRAPKEPESDRRVPRQTKAA